MPALLPVYGQGSPYPDRKAVLPERKSLNQGYIIHIRRYTAISSGWLSHAAGFSTARNRGQRVVKKNGQSMA